MPETMPKEAASSSRALTTGRGTTPPYHPERPPRGLPLLPPLVGVVLSILIALPALPASAAQKGKAVTIRDSKGKPVGLYKESHALVVGISFYSGGWPPLPGVRDDVQAVARALKGQGFQVTTVENPSKEELDSALTDFILNHGLEPDNRLVVYFAGHGFTHKPSYASDDPLEWMGYFVGREAPRPSVNFAEFRRHAISMQEVANLALEIEAKHVLFVFDSCFSGSVFSLSRAIPQDIEERTAKPVRQFITSGSADQEVPDQSIFRRQFIEALQGEGDLNGDGFVTGSELGLFLEEKVTNYSRRAQTPQYGKIRHHRLDKGDFVFVVAKAKEPARAEEAAPGAARSLEELERDRLALEEERQRLEAERRLLEERKKLEEEKERLAELRMGEASPPQRPRPGPEAEAPPRAEEPREPEAPPAGKPPGVLSARLPQQGPPPPVSLTRLSVSEAERQLKGLDWERYDGYRVLISQEPDLPFGRRSDIPLTDEPAIILVLKDSSLTVKFHGQELGSGEAQPMEGDLREAATAHLRRQFPHAYRVHFEGEGPEARAVLLVPQGTRLKAATVGRTLGVKVVGPESQPFLRYSVQFAR